MYPALTLTLRRLSRKSREARAIGLFAAVVIWSAPAGTDALTPQELLVVINERASISERIADYYQQVRGVPKHHVVRISTEPEEEIDRNTFKREVEGPIAAHLLRHRLVDQILGLVLTKGVPLKIRGTEGRAGTRASVDSELTLLYRELVQGPVAPEGPVPNPYFLPEQPRPFSRADYDIYLVTRLDGYEWEDVRGLMDRAGAPARHGKIVLDMKEAWPGSGSMAGEGWLRDAADRLKTSDLQVVLDQSSRVVTGETDVIGYAGWGSNDPANTRRSPGFQWLPGALASWFVSTSARTFVRPPASWTVGSWSDAKTFYAGSPQSLIGDLVAEGVTGAVGYVYEPYLDATARPQILFPAYRAGFTLAESFYMALPYLSWQSVVVGDPLVAPFEPPTGPRPGPVIGTLLFLERRVAVLETLAARVGSEDSRRALARVHAEKAQELARHNRLDDALGVARHALAVQADEPAALYALGAVHAARREEAEAKKAFRSLIRRAPTSAYAGVARLWLARRPDR